MLIVLTYLSLIIVVPHCPLPCPNLASLLSSLSSKLSSSSSSRWRCHPHPHHSIILSSSWPGCIILIVGFNIDPLSIKNKHESPSSLHRSRRPTSPSLYFTRRRCCLLFVVISRRQCLLSCIVIRLIVVLNIDPPLDRKQTQIPLSYSSQQTPYLDSVKFS